MRLSPENSTRKGLESACKQAGLPTDGRSKRQLCEALNALERHQERVDFATAIGSRPGFQNAMAELADHANAVEFNREHTAPPKPTITRRTPQMRYVGGFTFVLE